ncbi:DNA-binding protein [Coniochaeta sp. PMI_546]|nr:DNA-binding protein [Coniochaeta sp. PMI_546]
MSASEPTIHEVPLKEAHQLITTFTTFLTVSIHNILYYRHIYPPTTFLTSRAYNLPVHQNRHPKVCSWISDAVSAVATQLALGTVDRIAVVIHSPLHPESASIAAVPPGAVLERYLFDVSRFPSWPGGPDAMRDFGNSLRRRDEEEDDDRFPPAAPDEEDGEVDEAAPRPRRNGDGKINWTDVGEQFRGVLKRLSHAAEKLDPVPAGCTFTVAVELRDEAPPPIGHPQPWIPSQPNLQKPGGVDLGGSRTTPVRSVEAGPLFFECWVEEGKAKEILKDATPTQENTQSSVS